MAETIPIAKDRATGPVGQRISRRDSRELGTVVKTNGKIEMNWDSGQTSYYRHGERANSWVSCSKE